MERNWAGNVTYRAGAVEHPSSVAGVREMISRGGPLRVLGTRHCFNDIADTAGILFALDKVPLEIEVSEDRNSVRVSSGARYGDIAPVLEAEGLALSNLASLPHISVGGAVATGTHGSGDRIGSLSSTVRALTILTAGGEIRRLARGDTDFNGAVVSLGALGVVLDLTLDVEPTYRIAQHVYDRPRWDMVLESLDAVTGAGTSVSVFSRWQDADTADQIWVKQRQPDERAQERADALGVVALEGGGELAPQRFGLGHPAGEREELSQAEPRRGLVGPALDRADQHPARVVEAVDELEDAGERQVELALERLVLGRVEGLGQLDRPLERRDGRHRVAAVQVRHGERVVHVGPRRIQPDGLPERLDDAPHVSEQDLEALLEPVADVDPGVVGPVPAVERHHELRRRPLVPLHAVRGRARREGRGGHRELRAEVLAVVRVVALLVDGHAPRRAVVHLPGRPPERRSPHC